MFLVYFTDVFSFVFRKKTEKQRNSLFYVLVESSHGLLIIAGKINGVFGKDSMRSKNLEWDPKKHLDA